MIMPWSHWCRLCSKDNGCEIDLFDHKSEYDDENENENDTDLYKIIIKHFAITIDENDDSIPKGICQDCLKFVQNLKLFSDRQIKVERMFTKLIDDKLLSIGDIDFNDIRQQYGISNESTIVKCDQSTDTTDLRVTAAKSEPIEDYIYEEYQEINGNKDENEPLHEPICSLIKDENVCDEEETVGNATNQQSTTRREILTRKRRINAKKVEYIEDDEISEEGENNQNDGKDNDDDTDEYDSVEVGGDDDYDDDYHEKDKKIPKMNKTNDDVNQQQLKPKNKNFHVKAEIKCELCDKVFSRKFEKRNHMEKIHSEQQQCDYECSICNRKFTSARGLKQHEFVHLPRDEKMLYSCPFCDRKFIKAYNVNPHIRAKHSDEKKNSFICEDCGKIFPTKARLKEHRYTHIEETPFECSRCPMKFKNASRLKLHQDTHNDTVYVCPDCGVKFNTRTTFNKHKLIHSDEKKHKCEFCGMEFKLSKTLKNHLLIHAGIKPYVCQFCNKAFAQGSTCRNHKKKVHPAELAALEKAGKVCNPTPKIPKLEQLKAMAANSPFRMQPYREEEKKTFICEDCGKIFSTNVGLKKHRYTHIEETPFECSRCPKKFKIASRLRLHQDTHNDTVYVCPHCGIKFNTKSTLNKHKLIHSDEKKHKCEFCGRQFRLSKTLKCHLLLHAGIKPYVCQFCDKTFAQGTNCRIHKKKAHAAELAALEKAGKVCTSTPNIPKLEQLKAMAANSPFRMQPHKKSLQE